MLVLGILILSVCILSFKGIDFNDTNTRLAEFCKVYLKSNGNGSTV